MHQRCKGAAAWDGQDKGVSVFSVLFNAFNDSTFEPLSALRDVQYSKPFSVFSVLFSGFSDSKDDPATCTGGGVILFQIAQP